MAGWLVDWSRRAGQGCGLWVSRGIELGGRWRGSRNQLEETGRTWGLCVEGILGSRGGIYDTDRRTIGLHCPEVRASLLQASSSSSSVIVLEPAAGPCGQNRRRTAFIFPRTSTGAHYVMAMVRDKWRPQALTTATTTVSRSPAVAATDGLT